MKKILMTSAAALFALSTAVSAATLSIVGGTSGTIPGAGVNNVLGPLGLSNPLGGFFESSIGALGFGANDKVLVEVLGYEAGFRNTFSAGGDSYTGINGIEVGSFAAPLKRWTFALVGDVLDFTFSTNGGIGSVSNRDPNDVNNSTMNFFAHQLADGSILLFLDDRGAGPDDNHDDLVVRLSAVPLPAGALLLLTGLGALALRRRKTA